MNARGTSRFLYLVAKINPQAWDAIFPHGPKVSAASREYLVAMAIKGFAAELSNAGVKRRLAAVQKTLVKSSAANLAADYDDDDWCPTRPRPWPGPSPFGFSFDDVMLNPQPLPPKELQREIGGYLMMLSEATAQQAAAKDLAAIGKSMMR